MTDWQMRESLDELVLTHALEKLRMREGLTSRRLRTGLSGVVAPLLNLTSVQRFANVHHVDLADAAQTHVASCVDEALNVSDGIVADAVLGLGVFEARFRGAGIDAKVLSALRSDLLSRRRRALLANWNHLHAALGVESAVPSERQLRGSLEHNVLAKLAYLLVQRDNYTFSSTSRVVSGPGSPVHANVGGRGGRIVVIGGAVMDATFRVKTLPQVETSGEAYDFELAPGGKGLTQAVAVARLGLDVSLIAALADDEFGQKIEEYLYNENVDTSMLKHVRNARTPFVGVIEFELGDSLAINWRNAGQVRLDIEDIGHAKTQLHESDAVLVTFEPPRESVECALEAIHEAGDSRPFTVVTPGQPYTDQSIAGKALSQIDYLVAHRWELGRYGSSEAPFDMDAVARQILVLGVATICIPVGGGCTIYSDTLETFNVPAFPALYKESSAARDAFCAALAVKLIEGDREFSEEVALWATAAMAAAMADHPLRNAMPDRHRVDTLLERSRFTGIKTPLVAKSRRK